MVEPVLTESIHILVDVLEVTTEQTVRKWANVPLILVRMVELVLIG